MLFSPITLSSLWDTWFYYESGVHYLFYLASTRLDRPWDCIGVATSSDGVHFADHGPVVFKENDVEWLGTGDTWKAGDKYILNFSESREGKLEIHFAESDDLLHWSRIPASESLSRLDPKWYAEQTEFSEQRWDTISAIPNSEGDGFFGYVTAVAKDGPVGLRGTAGSVTSKDGRKFTTGAPVIETGVWGDRLEIGGVARIDANYYMFVAQAEIPLGLRWTVHHAQAAGGVYVLRADREEGPFKLDPRQRPILVSAPQHYTYFARFYRTGNEILASHHAISPVRDIVSTQPKPGTHLAPLKKVVVENGLLALRWWPGNEALKGREHPVTSNTTLARGLSSEPVLSTGRITLDANAGGQLALSNHFDLARGVVLEFDESTAAHDGRLAGGGLLIGHGAAWSGTVLLADSAGVFSVGSYNGYAFRAEDSKSLRAPVEKSRQWRVLIHDAFVEVYIDDDFVQAYTLPISGSGRISLIAESATVGISSLRSWEMTI